MQKSNFDVLLLIARPAAGKSEIIDYIKRLPATERIERFHVGKIEEIDDFPMLWTWFEEDRLLEAMGHPRLHTNQEGMFIENYLWDLLIERISLEYQKNLRERPDYHECYTTIVEFARGKEHGGFARAFQHLNREMLEKMAIMYVRVSWEESLRKNRQRFNPKRPDSILEHALSDEKLERLYKETDWEEVSAGDSKFINIKGKYVPFTVFENEDDVTTKGGERLGRRLEASLGQLWRLYQGKVERGGSEWETKK